ncbi:DUF1232 domain-containing protein [Pontibacter qinzhouensis]|uniref:DUF1232 domain-containing protein n=1 Tax=Pontibacter qinzhouensis TaxID=2603253 RepID=A0A5C8IZ81_9BACT|nr:DUF1232 domain-containing protein [Pontibacter qinzhouensis]TXK26571.1 DUF1232 domain-containing protein [Pontibacter qinzhouensis]
MNINELVNQGLKLTSHPMFKKFLGRAGGIAGKPAKLIMLVSAAYAKLIDAESPKNGFEQIKEVMLTFIRMVRFYANGTYRNISSKSLLVGVAVLLYWVTPLDIIPDFIPVIGLLDDISLMAWFIDSFQKEITKFRDWEAGASFEPNIGTL